MKAVKVRGIILGMADGVMKVGQFDGSTAYVPIPKNARFEIGPEKTERGTWKARLVTSDRGESTMNEQEKAELLKIAATGGRSFLEIEQEEERLDHEKAKAAERAILAPLLLRVQVPRDPAQFVVVDALERQICESLLSAWTATNAETPEAALLYLAEAFRYSGMLAVFAGTDCWRWVNAGPQDPTGWPKGCHEVMHKLLGRMR